MHGCYESEWETMFSLSPSLSHTHTHTHTHKTHTHTTHTHTCECMQTVRGMERPEFMLLTKYNTVSAWLLCSQNGKPCYVVRTGNHVVLMTATTCTCSYTHTHKHPRPSQHQQPERVLKEEVLNNLPWKDGRGPSSVKHWNCFKGNVGEVSNRWAGATIFLERTGEGHRQSNIGTVSKATLGKCLTDELERQSSLKGRERAIVNQTLELFQRQRWGSV